MKQLGACNGRLLKEKLSSSVAGSFRVVLNSCAVKSDPLRGPPSPP